MNPINLLNSKKNVLFKENQYAGVFVYNYESKQHLLNQNVVEPV